MNKQWLEEVLSLSNEGLLELYKKVILLKSKTKGEYIEAIEKEILKRMELKDA